MRLIEGGILQNIDILLMGGGNPPRDRTANEEGRIQPMQGHSPDISENDPRFYPGDEHIHGGNAQFQIHIINYHDSGGNLVTTTTLFALYIPEEEPRFDLSYVVRAGAYES